MFTRNYNSFNDLNSVLAVSALRIRPDNGIIRELDIPKDVLAKLQKIVSSPNTAYEFKKIMIKRLAKVSPCCVCGGIPSLEAVYDEDGASRVERYCESCATRVFSKSG